MTEEIKNRTLKDTRNSHYQQTHKKWEGLSVLESLSIVSIILSLLVFSSTQKVLFSTFLLYSFMEKLLIFIEKLKQWKLKLILQDLCALSPFNFFNTLLS